MANRVRRNFSLSVAVDQRIHERALASGEGRSREVERCVDLADGNDLALRAALQPILWRILNQCAIIRQSTAQPAALEAAEKIHREIVEITARLAEAPAETSLRSADLDLELASPGTGYQLYISTANLSRFTRIWQGVGW